jgi:hypothetical protein
MAERMLISAGIGPAMNVLDVGSGVGDVSFLVSDHSRSARRWGLFVLSMLPRILAHELASEADVDLDTLESRLLDQADRTGGRLPLSWLTVAQWARKPMGDG